VDGQPCIKNKFIITDLRGKDHESIVWKATDLNEFPIKIEAKEQGQAIIVLYKKISLTKPSASQFEPPVGFTKYDSMEAMIEQQMKKHGDVPPADK
jgi:hypothetical protein